jgi:hypothetical protein
MGKSKDRMIRLPVALAREIKIEAAKRDMSIGKLIADAFYNLTKITEIEKRGKK